LIVPCVENIRIDKGIKRGARPGRKPSSPRRNNGSFLAKLSNNPDDILAALRTYQSGATLQQIADQHGVTKQAVYGWLLGELGGEQHTMLVTQALTSRIANADCMLETANNALDLARGREMARNARMDLERRRSSLYGQKQEITHNVQPILVINAPVAAPKLVEGEVIENDNDTRKT